MKTSGSYVLLLAKNSLSSVSVLNISCNDFSNNKKTSIILSIIKNHCVKQKFA